MTENFTDVHCLENYLSSLPMINLKKLALYARGQWLMLNVDFLLLTGARVRDCIHSVASLD